MAEIPCPTDEQLLGVIDLSGVDPFQRIQTGWRMKHAFPVMPGVCACGCGTKLEGRCVKWAHPSHGHAAYHVYAIFAGYSGEIRSAVFERDQGVCAACGTVHAHAWPTTWEADHILEVVDGGGGCWLDNYQTLCTDPCHKAKTAQLITRRAQPIPDEHQLALEVGS